MEVRKSRRFGAVDDLPDAAELLWPYASTQMLEARDISTIGGQARAVLAKALTSGRTLAFVGSGVSNCYGRMTWAEMVAMLDAQAKKAGGSEEVGANRLWKDNPRIAGLWQTLEAIDYKPNDSASSAALVDTADLAINIIDRISELKNLSAEPQESKARDLIKASLVDDAGHMRRLLHNLHLTSDQESRLDTLNARQLRRYFTSDILRRLLKDVPIDNPARGYEFVLRAYSTGGLPLQVRHRFMIPLLVMIKHPKGKAGESMAFLEQLVRRSAAAPARPPRSHFVPPDRDPLLLMYDMLGLRRYFTTNWDQEIERLFDDKGLARRGDAEPLDNEPGDDEAKRVVGHGESTVLVYDQTKATGLAAFAAQDKLNGPGVAYLHGRATPKDRIVVTGRDYRDLYLKRSDFLAMSQAALKLTFGGNPILFVGLGMEEEDVLRPLREFMSGAEGMDNRPIVAILPATHDISRVKAQASRLLNDFGVLTIYYGANGANLGAEETWLHDRHTDIKNLETAILAGKPFTSRGDIEPPSSLDGLAVADNQSFDLAHECQMLNVLLATTKHAMATAGKLEGAPLDVILSSLRELKYQLQGGFLCATLRRIADYRDNWHDSWLDTTAVWEPEPALTLGSETDPPEVYAFGATYLKTGMPGEDNEELRFDRGAPSQTFNGLIDALKAHQEALDTMSFQAAGDHAGRRILLLVGDRGVGRGHFFSSMREKRRIELLHRTLCGPGRPQWTVQAFLSVGQRVDITATRHNFTEALLRFLKKRNEITPEDSLPTVVNERLADLLARASSAKGNDRMLVAFNALDLWFDPSGRGKNRVIDEFLVQLFGKQGRHLPIDFVVIGGARTLPHFFGKDGLVEDNKPFEPRTLMRDYEAFRPWELRKRGLSPTDHRELDRRRDSLGIDALYLTKEEILGQEGARERALGRQKNTNYGMGNYFHVLRPARASIVLPAFMPELACAYVVSILEHEGYASKIDQGPEWGFSVPPVLRKRIRSHMEQTADGHVIGTQVLRAIIQHLVDRDMLDLDPSGKIDVMLRLVDNKFKSLFKMVERQRYALSLLGACADEIITANAKPPFAATYRDLYEFFERFRRDLETIDRRDREAAVIRLSLEEFRRRHERGGTHLPLRPPREIAQLIRSDNPLFNLQHTILWHLAAFGQPVRFDVILDSPEIQRAARQVFKPHAATGRQLTSLIGYAIRLLVYRCLVLPLDRRGELKFENRRYGTHRSMQLYVLRWLGSPPFEFQEINQFSVTSYLNQPKDMPRLKRRTHVDLRRTISAFIGFPDIDGELAKEADARVGAAASTTDVEAVLEANRERASAAISTMRSVYSVASIARLGSLEGDLIEAQDASGLFTEHARQVRWLLLKNSVTVRGLLTGDDIVWALNECGVMSHIRGHLSDANVLFDLAERAASGIESSQDGPLRTRIFLNRAIVMIEQGRGKDADPRLATIANNGRENKIIRQLAIGMGGLIDHLAGRVEIAESTYSDTVRLLEAWDRPRSASFFSRHLGNLLASKNTAKDMNDANRKLEASITLAEEGGHQDMRHEALAAQAGLQISQGEVRSPEVLSQLLTAEDYARRVGMSRLVVEVHLHRGRFHMGSGDLTRAVEEFSEALRLAVGNRHKLRVISALTYLADALSRTSARDGCGALLDLATTMAQSTDYFTGLARAQQLRMEL